MIPGLMITPMHAEEGGLLLLFPRGVMASEVKFLIQKNHESFCSRILSKLFDVATVGLTVRNSHSSCRRY